MVHASLDIKVMYAVDKRQNVWIYIIWITFYFNRRTYQRTLYTLGHAK